MTKEELTWKMRSISESEFKGDVENRHKAADKLIIQWLRENGCERQQKSSIAWKSGMPDVTCHIN